MDDGKKKAVINGVAIGCAALRVLLAFAAGTLYVKRRAIVAWARVTAVQNLSRRLLLDLPDGMDRGRTARDLQLLEKRAKDGSVDRIRLAAILNAMGRALEDNRLDRQEADTIMAQIERVME